MSQLGSTISQKTASEKLFSHRKVFLGQTEGSFCPGRKYDSLPLRMRGAIDYMRRLRRRDLGKLCFACCHFFERSFCKIGVLRQTSFSKISTRSSTQVGIDHLNSLLVLECYRPSETWLIQLVVGA